MDLQKGIKHLIINDQQMERIVVRVGEIDLPAPRSPFETLVEAIISQQVSTKAAATIHSRLVALLENELTPHHLLNYDQQELRCIGISRQKASYLHALAEAFANKPVLYDRLSEMDDAEVIASLTSIKGIGVWTAQMFLIFTLLREDVFPIDDLGIRRSMERFIFSENEQPSKMEMTKRAELWAPYRSVASLILWKAID